MPGEKLDKVSGNGRRGKYKSRGSADRWKPGSTRQETRATGRCNLSAAFASNGLNDRPGLRIGHNPTSPSSIMTTHHHTQSASSIVAVPASESHAVQTTHTLLKYLFTAVPIIAGADKFTNILAQWDAYLNPLALRIVPVSASTFMHLVGVIEIVAGILVFVRPRLGGFVVMGWLLAIALQLVVWGQFLDIAVRDIVIALSGPFILAQLTPFVLRGGNRSVPASNA